MKIEKIKSANTKIIGKNIIYFSQTESTHKYAIENIQDLPDGTIVISEFQKGGIGTYDRKWYSERNKNIMMSIILKPKKELKILEDLTVKIACCMKNVIFDLYGYTLEIKFPNDLLLNGKKICGILTRSKK